MNQEKIEPVFLTTRQVMELLHCSPTTLYRYSEKEKKFPCYTISGKRLYKQNEVLNAIKVK